MSEANQRAVGAGSPESGRSQKPPAHDEAPGRLPPITPPPPGTRGSVRPSAPPLSPSTPLAPTVEREPPQSAARLAPASVAPTPAQRAAQAAQEERVVRLSIGG